MPRKAKPRPPTFRAFQAEHDSRTGACIGWVELVVLPVGSPPAAEDPARILRRPAIFPRFKRRRLNYSDTHG